MGSEYKKLSMYLCCILRHKPQEIGDPHEVMDSHGWVNVQTLISGVNNNSKYKLTMEILEQIVADDEKGRYLFDKNKNNIKCCQGHSVEWVEPELVYTEPPEFLYHGTNTNALKKIISSGHISKMNRHAVHMQADFEKARNSAERWHNSDPVVLKIAALDLYSNHSVKFGVSENGVWCAEDIPLYAIIDYIY